MLDFETCNQARLRRDPAFDGLFFVAVTTTNIYCRPVCRVKQPARRMSASIQRGGGRAGGISTLPALPARNGALLSGLERHENHGRAGAATDRERRPGRRERGRSGRQTGRRSASPLPAVSGTPRRIAAADRANPAHPTRQTAAERHLLRMAEIAERSAFAACAASTPPFPSFTGAPPRRSASGTGPPRWRGRSRPPHVPHRSKTVTTVAPTRHRPACITPGQATAVIST